MASCRITMNDGWSDSWGYSKLKAVYENRGSFQQAIAKLDKAIETLERCEGLLSPVPGNVQDLWGDYWATERLMDGFDTCEKEYEKAIDKLTRARDDLQRLLDAAIYCKNHKWFKKSDAQTAWDGFKKVATLGSSGSFDDAKNSSYP